MKVKDTLQNQDNLWWKLRENKLVISKKKKQITWVKGTTREGCVRPTKHLTMLISFSIRLIAKFSKTSVVVIFV